MMQQKTPNYIDRTTENNEIIEVEEGIITVLMLVSEAIASYRAFVFEGEGLVNSHIAQINGATLQYFIITQFGKLTETSGKQDEADSSLYKLNGLLRRKYPEWESVFNENSKLLKEITDAPFYQTIRTLRNHCYAHSVRHPANTKMGFKFLSQNEFLDYMELFRKSIVVFRNIYQIYDSDYTDFEYVIKDDRPLNFLKNHKKYQEFYLKHFLKFPEDN